MSELLQVGNQCGVCPQVDFLPIRCRCDKFFCKAHISPDAHACSVSRSSEKTEFEDKLNRCHIESCSKPTLNLSSSGTDDASASCPQCKNCFCSEHRHPDTHNCATPKSETPKNETARALLAKHFPTKAPSNAIGVSSTTSKPKSTAQQKLELMKMRQRAIPLDPKDKSSSVSPNQRRFIRAKIQGATEEKIVWVQKTMTTGRVFDMLASHLGLSSSQWNRYRLCKVFDDQTIPLPNDKVFADAVDDGSLVVFVAQ